MTPDLQLRTLYVLDPDGRLVCTNEPERRRPPAFKLIRGMSSVVWAVRDDVDGDLAAQLERIASTEPPAPNLLTEPRYAWQYLSLISGRIEAGPAYTFPDSLPGTDGVELIDETGERAPVFAVLDDGKAVSTCMCARRSDEAAEAGLETLEPYRGRGFGPRVTTAWAAAIRASERVPLYSTSWTNESSRRVAAKLGLIPYAADWSINDSSSRA